jgi:outer membrane putative beta-barrel porin/alpha-amylase
MLTLLLFLALVADPAVKPDHPSDAAATTAVEADAAMDVDRSTYTESSGVVGPGVLQLEMGTTAELDGAGDMSRRTLTAPLGLLRVGIGRRFELRFSDDGYTVASTSTGGVTERVSGRTNAQLGLKYVVVDSATRGFAMAVVPMVGMPTGTAGLASGTYEPTVKLAWANDLPQQFNVAGNVKLARLGAADGRFVQHTISVALARDFAPGWSAVGEVYGLSALERGGRAAWTVDAGVTRMLGANLRLDFECGHGISAAASDWSIGGGLAVRTTPWRGPR